MSKFNEEKFEKDWEGVILVPQHGI